MTYITRIDEVAQRYQLTKPFLNRAMDLWQIFENMARLVGYDILADNLCEEHELRNHIRALIMTLYEQEGASSHADCAQLREKDAIYGGSWCRRGGPGAFMMLARKADRVEQFLKNGQSAINADTEDTLGDWRRYLILVEAWHVDRERPAVEILGEQILAMRAVEAKHCVDAKLTGYCDTCGASFPSGSPPQLCYLPF